jgi:hypothetical protein
MQQDMQLRGIDADQYRARVISPQVDAAVSGLPRGRTAATKQANDFLSRLLTTTNVVDSRKHATELIGKTEVHFNTVFNSLASNVNRNAASSDSPADEATLGFARFLATHDRGPAVRIVNNEHADLYLDAVFQQRVNGNNRSVEVTVGRAVRVAKAVGGLENDPDARQALEILQLQGGIRATYARAPRNARPQQSLTAIARRLMASQNLSYAAALRLPEVKELAIAKLSDAAGCARYPAFFGPGHDWMPDHNWGGSAMVGLQEMLLAPDPAPSGKLYLFPAWPEAWDVRFKLHAPQNTMIECELRAGKIVKLEVTPASRRKDVEILGPSFVACHPCLDPCLDPCRQ